jgi:uncharacterized protein
VIFVDYPRQARLKVLGKLEILEGEKASQWLEKVRCPDYKAAVDSVYVIHVEAFDWNCPQHITPRFTADQIQKAIAPIEKRMQELEDENRKLREQLAVASQPVAGLES